MPPGKLFYRRKFGIVEVDVGQYVGKQTTFAQKRNLSAVVLSLSSFCKSGKKSKDKRISFKRLVFLVSESKIFGAGKHFGLSVA